MSEKFESSPRKTDSSVDEREDVVENKGNKENKEKMDLAKKMLNKLPTFETAERANTRVDKAIRDTVLYNDPKRTIEDIYREKLVSPEEWEETMRHFQTAMELDFELLQEDENISDADVLNVTKKALKKVGNPQFRKQLVQELHTLAKTVKPENKKKVVDSFVEALEAQSEFKKPRKISKLMQDILNIQKVPPPPLKSLTPKAFLASYDKLEESDIDNFPPEIQEILSRLLDISREFGIARSYVKAGLVVNDVNIAKMNKSQFKDMCADIFGRLREVEESVESEDELIDSKEQRAIRKKSKIFTKLLRSVLTSQLVVIEELIFSDELFIPGELRQVPATS